MSLACFLTLLPHGSPFDICKWFPRKEEPSVPSGFSSLIPSNRIPQNVLICISGLFLLANKSVLDPKEHYQNHSFTKVGTLTNYRSTTAAQHNESGLENDGFPVSYSLAPYTMEPFTAHHQLVFGVLQGLNFVLPRVRLFCHEVVLF